MLYIHGGPESLECTTGHMYRASDFTAPVSILVVHFAAFVSNKIARDSFDPPFPAVN